MRPFVVLVAFLSLVSCSASRAPVVETPAVEDSAVETPVAETPAAETPAAETGQGLSLALSGASTGQEKQCKAGDTQACLSLCQQKVAVCVEGHRSYDKKACDKLAEDRSRIPLCTRDESPAPGSLCVLEASKIVPTQSSVGMFAAECRAHRVKYKRDGSERSRENLKRYLLEKPVPAIVGPGGGFYITDRHHLSTGVLKADIDEDRKNLYMCTLADKRDESRDRFWQYMKSNNFTWLYDNRGQQIEPKDLPSRLSGLADDPYRTFSRWVRDSCGYVKCDTVCGGRGGTRNTNDLETCKTCSVSPFFLEFRWANYLRSKIRIPGIYDLRGKAQAAALARRLDEAIGLAGDPEALEMGLPGWNHSLIETQRIRFDPESHCDL